MRWVGFVRNVMIGREGLHRSVLLDIAAGVGAAEPRSHLSTGNLTFTAAEDDLPGIVTGLEAGVERTIGRHELVAVRAITWLATMVDSNPFDGLDEDAWVLEIAMLRHDAPPLDPARLADSGRTSIVRAQRRELLAARPPSGTQRPHVNKLLENATGSPATSRGWGTVRRIVARE